MRIWLIARKDLRLLFRDPRAAILLLLMPIVFILMLALLLGRMDDRVRVSLVDMDQGDRFALIREGMARFAVTGHGGFDGDLLTAAALAGANRATRPPTEPWSQVVLRDLDQTAGIRVEKIPTRELAEQLVRDNKRSAVLVFEPTFSERVTASSFLSDGINPFHRDGVNIRLLDMELLVDPTQRASASIIGQVAQVTLLRVVLPWMIGRAFERLSEEQFIDLICNQVYLPVPLQFRFLVKTDGEGKAPLQELLRTAAAGKPAAMSDYKQRVGRGVQESLAKQFEKYNLTGKTWADLTRSEQPATDTMGFTTYGSESSLGVPPRGALLYQTLVPSSMVMFAFFLVLTVSWLFVSERRQGTLRRMRAAPVTRTEILLGKLVPPLLLSLLQGVLLLLAGKLAFGMSWGPQPLWLLPVVATTALAAMGMALFIAALARTEAQAAIYGTLLVLVLGFISGCIVPRALMPEEFKRASLITPHAWALDAYAQLLLNPDPNYALVGQACAVLAAFGIGFVALAWRFLKLE